MCHTVLSFHTPTTFQLTEKGARTRIILRRLSKTCKAVFCPISRSRNCCVIRNQWTYKPKYPSNICTIYAYMHIHRIQISPDGADMVGIQPYILVDPCDRTRKHCFCRLSSNGRERAQFHGPQNTWSHRTLKMPH